MNTPQEHQGEHERREGLGSRVRRFVDDELGRIRDKENRGTGTRTDHPGDPDPADRGDVLDRTHEPAPAQGTPAAEGTPVQGTLAQETQRAHEPAPARHSEPVGPNAGGPSYADRPATAPHDAGREPTLQSARSEEFRGRSGDQPTAEGSAAQVGLLNDVASLRDEWQRVQGTFVDDPQRAVHEASMLIDRTLDEIRANVGSKHASETMSTEDLRVSFQRYREFFQRLLSA
ncbi:MAG: hypothetical protein ACRDRY_08695 [Pseudonocardiaceae bacterium]